MKTMMENATRLQNSNPLRSCLTSVGLAASLANIALLTTQQALAEPPPIDLATTALSVNTSPAVAGQTIDVSHSVTRTGDEIEQGWVDHFYLSIDDVFDGAANEIDLGFVNVSGEDTYSLTTQLTLPADVAGKYHLLVVIDAENAVTESDETNNVMSASFPITSGYPDLVPDSLSVTGDVVIGQPFTFDVSIKNIGLSTIEGISWNDQVYLSSDNNLDEGDYPTGEPFTQSINLGPDTGYTQNRGFWMPAEATPGQWYLIVKTDSSDNVLEAEEENNTIAYPISVRAPNLAPDTITADAALQVGIESTVTVLTYNRGDASTPGEPSWQDCLYLSENDVFDESDRQLTEPVSIGSTLEPGASYERIHQVTVPTDVPAGTYYLLAVADTGNAVIESDENDNVLATQITVISQSNLRPTYVVPGVEIINNRAPGSADSPQKPMPRRRLSVLNAGQQEIIEYSVTNDGTAPAEGSWWDSVYLSDDDTFDPEQDTYLGGNYRTDNPVQPGESYYERFTTTISQLPPGDYYLILVVDSDSNAIAESNEEDNILVDQVLVVAPDLRPSACSTNNPVLQAGQDEVIQYTITNDGTGWAPPSSSWSDSIFLSTDEFIDESDEQLYGGEPEYGALYSSDSYTRDVTIRVPETEPGIYYLIVLADYNWNTLYEGDEVNNTAAFQVAVVAPDLNPTACQPVTPNLQSGRSGEIDYTITNIGTGAVPESAAWLDLIYFSEDEFLSDDDVNIGGAKASGPLNEDDDYTQRVSVGIPLVPEGDYYLIIACDHPNNGVFESDETNNNIAFPVRIDATDLHPTAITVSSGNVKPGSAINIDYTVINSGMAPVPDATAWKDLVYLSRDAVVDGSDEMLVWGPEENTPMSHGDTYSRTVTTNLPNLMAPGDWYLIIRADAWWDQVKEGNETNNDLAFQISIGQTHLWWADGHNLQGQDALPEANPSADGINNLLKYAFGMNPNVAYGPGRILDPGVGTSGLPVVTVGEDSRLRVEYVRRLQSMDLGYQVQFSSGLGVDDWTPAPKGAEITYPIDDEWERVVATDLDASPYAEKRFGRVRILSD